MSTPTDVFREFFGPDESYPWFTVQHRVDSINDVPGMRAACTRADRFSKPVSVGDKPALVIVHDKGPTETVIEWHGAKGLHRDAGPAQIFRYRDGRIAGIWYRNGVKTKGPISLKSVQSLSP